MDQEQLFTNLFGDAGRAGPAALRKIAEDHPYFVAAHYLLLANTAPDDQAYTKLAEKTAYLFQNPFLLNFRLNEFATSRNNIISTPANSGLAEAQRHPNTQMKDELLFEPLHTTDYFASQGINLSEEVRENDKLGKQLRSFTDWLKTMKKIQGMPLIPVNEQPDQLVEEMAEKSNLGDEVLTESMAEVFISQGKFRKAADIYEKLSLLDPGKSAYFAAKLESLKGK